MIDLLFSRRIFSNKSELLLLIILNRIEYSNDQIFIFKFFRNDDRFNKKKRRKTAFKPKAAVLCC